MRKSGSQISGNGNGSFDKVQAPVILITAFVLGEFHHFRKIGPGLRRRRRYARLLDTHMVDYEPRVGVAVDQRRARVDVAQNRTLTGKSFWTAARRKAPAVVRFLSVEPMLEAIDLLPWLSELDWLIVGGESGVGNRSRPMHPDWVRDLRDQVWAAGGAFF